MIFGPPAERNLFPTERRLVRIRTHWATLSKVLAQSVGAVLVLDWVLARVAATGDGSWPIQTVLYLTEWFAIMYLLYHVMVWWDDRIFVTDQRYLRVYGLIKIKVDMMPIDKVTDGTYTRTVMGRLLGYGTVRVETAGQKQALEYINYIPQPKEVYEAMFETR